MNKDVNIYIHHILLSVDRIFKFTEGQTWEDFSKSYLLQDAVIRNLEIIGEASKNVPSAYKDAHPEIEWKKMAGMRDRLIHDYMGVDIAAVWAVVTHILPELKRQLSD